MRVSFKRLRLLFGCSAAFGFIASFTAYPANAAQTIFDVAKTVMNQPSMLTRQAVFGLFNSVARAGSRLVAAGQDGRIILSDDNGLSWRQVETPTSVTLTHVVFADSEQGWAVGQMAVVLHTVDGGAHWVMQFDGFRVNQTLLASAQAAVAAQPKDANAATYLQAAQQLASGGPSLPFLTIFALSKTELVTAGGFGLVFASHDGGATWQPMVSQVPNPNQFHIYAIIKAGDGQVWAGEQGLALERDASGAFKILTTPFQGSFFGALESPGGALILYGLQGTILRSADRALSWQQIPSTTAVGIDAGVALNNGNLLLGDEDGHLLLSRDDGKSFTMTQLGDPVISLAQASNGDVITAGPRGMGVVKLAALQTSAAASPAAASPAAAPPAIMVGAALGASH